TRKSVQYHFNNMIPFFSGSSGKIEIGSRDSLDVSLFIGGMFIFVSSETFSDNPLTSVSGKLSFISEDDASISVSGKLPETEIDASSSDIKESLPETEVSGLSEKVSDETNINIPPINKDTSNESRLPISILPDDPEKNGIIRSMDDDDYCGEKTYRLYCCKRTFSDSPLYKTQKRNDNRNTDFLALDMSTGQSHQQQQQLQLVEQQDNYIHSRASAIESIESTISELGNIFQQLATMVAEQRETVQRIDANTEEIQNHVEVTNIKTVEIYPANNIDKIVFFSSSKVGV
ncbi:13384_t:CDS:2, partial [Entrophospora sp. SA101]